MRPLNIALAATLLLTSTALAQTAEIYSIRKPPGILHGWGSSLEPIPDLDGDGVMDLAIGVLNHGGGIVASVHSGASGALLYLLDTPHVPLFFGDGIVSVADQNGDGVRELVIVGSHSGDSNSPDGLFQVHSGLDGSLLHSFAPPAGLFLLAHSQSSLQALADIDGDGSEDILAHTGSVAGRSLTLFSSTTGQVLYSVTPTAPSALLGRRVARLSDHDGDGLNDFAVAITTSFHKTFEIRSTADGTLIASREAKALLHLTGNLEPFLSVADADGDGLRDLVAGAVFAGFVGRFSSADGEHLGAWDCSARPIECFGSRVIEVEDFTGDGLPDLLAIESLSFVPGSVRLFGLDPASGAVVFEDSGLHFSAGYVSAESIVALPGVDPRGNPSFAVFEDSTGRVSVRRVK